MANVYQEANGKWRARTCVARRRASRTFATEAAAREWAGAQESAKEGMTHLRRHLSHHTIAPYLPPRFRQAVNQANYTEAEILAHAFPLPAEVGIYFLIRAGAVVYVGQTNGLLARLARHRQLGKKFDAFAFIPCEPTELDALERTYICLLLPEGNSTL
jgi:hypothetical protein